MPDPTPPSGKDELREKIQKILDGDYYLIESFESGKLIGKADEIMHIIAQAREEAVEAYKLHRKQKTAESKIVNSSTERRCQRCKVVKPLTEYFRDRSKPLGRNYLCKECDMLANTVYRAKVRGTDVSRAFYRKHRSRLVKKPIERQKLLARGAVSDAIRDGRIVKPPICEQCGATGLLHAHHYAGYDDANRYKVSWLCKPCHEGLHRELREAAFTAKKGNNK